MREIKFRAWDFVNKIMNEDIFIDGAGNAYDYASTTYNTPNTEIQRCEFPVMQYTGLKDRNGVEIYEYSELDGGYEVIFKDLRYSLRYIPNNDIIDLQDYWRDKNGEIEVTREYTKV